MIRVITVVGLVVVLTAWQQIPRAQAVEFSGYARNYTAVLLDDENDYAMLQNTFNLKIEQSNRQASFFVNPVLYDNDNEDPRLDLRQAYIDLFFDLMDIRVGKQQVVWGKADGVFITDVVSPKNMSEFILPEFEEIRIGVNAAKIDTYFGNNTLEFVWIPTFTPAIQPSTESIWYVAPDYPLPYRIDTGRQEVENKLGNSELFIKFSAMLSSVDFEVMAGSMWDDEPTRHVYRVVDPNTKQPYLNIVPEYHRLGLFGGSFSKTIRGMVMRGESAYYLGRYFATTDPQASGQVEKKDLLHFMLGLDFSLGPIDMSIQTIRQHILQYEDPIIQDQDDDIVTWLIRTDFMRDLLTVEMMSYVHLNDQDALCRPRLIYELFDGVSFETGVNVFTGKAGIYGRFDKNDNIYSKLKVAF